MKITVSDQPINKISAEVLVFPLFEDEIKSLPSDLKEILGKEQLNLEDEFSAKLFETFLLPLSSKILLVGAGKKSEFNTRSERNVAGAAARRLVKSKVKSVAIDTRIFSKPSLIIQGFGLAQFDSGIHKTKEKSTRIEELIISGKLTNSDIRKAQALVEATNWARSIVLEPANKVTPKSIVDEARKISRTYKLSIEVYDEKEAAKKGMGAFVGIARGSHQPSYMVALKYNYRKDVPTLGVVGKGITFDSGGISIKPSDKMHEMKMDMAGAAATIAFMRLVGEFKPKINVVGVVPLTENLPGGGALKPGDVVKALNGKTIEVLNTDAEGRVVLADALVLAQRLGATKIVDIATLTGAAIVALGSEASAALGNKEDFLKSVVDSGEEAGERIWALPIFPEHKELLRSDIEDIANTPPTRGAGVIAGAVFLQEFIEKNNSWVHLDIAGTAWLDGEKPYLAKGPTGVGIRTLLNLLDKLS